MSLTRRSLLAGVLALGVAPAFVRPGILMPIKTLWVPRFVPFTVRQSVIAPGDMVQVTPSKGSSATLPPVLRFAVEMTGIAVGINEVAPGRFELAYSQEHA